MLLHPLTYNAQECPLLCARSSEDQKSLQSCGMERVQLAKDLSSEEYFCRSIRCQGGHDGLVLGSVLLCQPGWTADLWATPCDSFDALCKTSWEKRSKGCLRFGYWSAGESFQRYSSAGLECAPNDLFLIFVLHKTFLIMRWSDNQSSELCDQNQNRLQSLLTILHLDLDSTWFNLSFQFPVSAGLKDHPATPSGISQYGRLFHVCPPGPRGHYPAFVHDWPCQRLPVGQSAVWRVCRSNPVWLSGVFLPVSWLFVLWFSCHMSLC